MSQEEDARAAGEKVPERRKDEGADHTGTVLGGPLSAFFPLWPWNRSPAVSTTPGLLDEMPLPPCRGNELSPLSLSHKSRLLF